MHDSLYTLDSDCLQSFVQSVQFNTKLVLPTVHSFMICKYFGDNSGWVYGSIILSNTFYITQISLLSTVYKLTETRRAHPERKYSSDSFDENRSKCNIHIAQTCTSDSVQQSATQQTHRSAKNTYSV